MKIKLFLAVLIVGGLSLLAVSFDSQGQRYSGAIFITNNPFPDTTAVIEDSVEMTFVESWKSWRTVENHSFGKDRGNMPMIADLQSLHPYFRDKIYKLVQVCKDKGIELAVVESYRTHAKQSEYYKMGRKYTRSAGGKSKHQYGLAVDVVPMVNNIPQWDNTLLWRKVGVEGEKLGLRWGGRWKSPYDPAHFEWSGGLTLAQLAAGLIPVPPASAHYPCIEDDIKELRAYWDKWEIEQKNFNTRTSPSVASVRTARP